ncbi:MAG TPA: type I polyketide synthase [Dictyobacter sp.]|nr:type I polyketide synthase [Dictyobacter sp.]
MAPTTHPGRDKGINFGLIFFSSSETPFSGEKYHLVLESAKFADQHDFSSIWIPERHFTKDGWLYPNPAVLHAALARETSQIRLNAGSVVVPLHNPLRVAEEWAMVDNLSNGRVGVSFASGWHPNDFALAPDNYEQRNELMYKNMDIVRKLWRGESVQVKSGNGSLVDLKTYPTPVQSELPFWVTAAGNPKTFAGAGEMGANLLTHMYNQSVADLAEKLNIYREARAKVGLDPATGKVAVMLHAFVNKDEETVRAQVKGPFVQYLRSASYLVNAIAYSRGQQIDISTLPERDLNDYLQFVFERLISTQRVLFGTPESCLQLVKDLKSVGVNEIACQMDFGVDSELVMQSLPYLAQLRDLANPDVDDASIPYQPSITLTSSNGHTPASTTPTPKPQPAERLTELQLIQKLCQEKILLEQFYQQLDQHGIQLGNTFRSITQLWSGKNEALGEVRLNETLQATSATYQIHPALLDACLQVLIAALPKDALTGGKAVYLPTNISKFRVYRQPGEHVWSHAVLTSDADPGADSYTGNVRILDDNGFVLAEAHALKLQRAEEAAPSETPATPVYSTYQTGTAQPVAAPAPQRELDQWLYQLQWEHINFPAPQQAPIAQQGGKWLLFADSPGIGDQLAAQLRQFGATPVLVEPGYRYVQRGSDHFFINPERQDDVHTLLKTVLADTNTSNPLRGVVHLWSLDATPTAQTTVNSLITDQDISTSNALTIIQALVDQTGHRPAHLWLVTRGAQPVQEQAEISIAQAPIWGLGKTAAFEHPELWGGLIDLDPQSTPTEAASQIMQAISGAHHEDQVAFRQGQSYVARMVRSTKLEQKPLQIRSDASYLITGGLWGLGLEVARWLTGKGARHLVLIGRSTLPPVAEWDRLPADSRAAIQVAGIRSLEELGAKVHYAALDVTNEQQLRAFLNDYRLQGLPPIKGVIHAASVWQDAQGQSLVRPLVNLTPEAFRAVFGPKIIGTWLLHTLLKDAALDFFTSFSSGASLFGSAAQGNYAAASEFMDVFAYHQRQQGQLALSVDWGAISEIGFGATPEGIRVHEYWESHGIQRINPRQVLNALEFLIPQGITRIGVIKLDWELLHQYYPKITSLPLVTHLAPKTGSPAAPIQQPQVQIQQVQVQQPQPQVQAQQSQPQPTSNAVQDQNTSPIIQKLRDTQDEQRINVLQDYLREHVAGVIRLPAAQLDIDQPLTALGLDSLMAIELKNRLEMELSIRIPIVTFLQGPSIVQFATKILPDVTEVLATVTPTSTTIPAPTPVTPDLDKFDLSGSSAEQLLARLNQLSDEQIDQLLSQIAQKEDQIR